jgi:hypothetical protein
LKICNEGVFFFFLRWGLQPHAPTTNTKKQCICLSSNSLKTRLEQAALLAARPLLAELSNSRMKALAAGKKYPFNKVDIQKLMYHHKLACKRVILLK